MIALKVIALVALAAGIYFLCRRVYEESEDFISIREYNAEEERWVMLTDSSIYSPTLLEYGRGESYHLATVEGNPLQFPSPTLPEAKNLLSPRFTSRFTTDGMSIGFTLPLMNLDDELISATLKLGGKAYLPAKGTFFNYKAAFSRTKSVYSGGETGRSCANYYNVIHNYSPP